MQLIIAAVGHKMPAWIETGFQEYAKRMPPECKLVLKEIKPIDRASNKNAEAVMAQERTRIEAVLPKGGRMIALDERGQDLTTMQMSQLLTQWQQQGGDVTFVIGGADGLDAEGGRLSTSICCIKVTDDATNAAGATTEGWAMPRPPRRIGRPA